MAVLAVVLVGERGPGTGVCVRPSPPGGRRSRDGGRAPESGLQGVLLAASQVGRSLLLT